MYGEKIYPDLLLFWVVLKSDKKSIFYELTLSLFRLGFLEFLRGENSTL